MNLSALRAILLESLDRYTVTHPNGPYEHAFVRVLLEHAQILDAMDEPSVVYMKEYMEDVPDMEQRAA